MASRLTTTQCDQEIAGSTPVSVIFFHSLPNVLYKYTSSTLNATCHHLFGFVRYLTHERRDDTESTATYSLASINDMVLPPVQFAALRSHAVCGWLCARLWLRPNNRERENNTRGVE